MKVKNAVWVTADRSKAVHTGHEDAAFLLVGANGELSDAEAKRLHVTENGVTGSKAEPLINASHMVTDATPDGINTSPDSPQAKVGLTTVTTTDNVKPNKTGVHIQKEGDKPSVQRDVQAKQAGNLPVKDEPPAAKVEQTTSKTVAPSKRG